MLPESPSFPSMLGDPLAWLASCLGQHFPVFVCPALGCGNVGGDFGVFVLIYASRHLCVDHRAILPGLCCSAAMLMENLGLVLGLVGTSSGHNFYEVPPGWPFCRGLLTGTILAEITPLAILVYPYGGGHLLVP